MGFDGPEIVGDEDIGAGFGTGFVETAAHEERLCAGTHTIYLDQNLVLYWDVKLFQHDYIAPIACQSERSLTH